jgi:tryptophan-rich hypothetical protein
MTTRLNPRKLLLSKWTAATPRDREKHFIVVELVEPENQGDAPRELVLEAVHSKRRQTLAWRDLTDAANWLQGWR